jgi:hypothetical protein
MSETPPAGAGGFFKDTSKLGVLRTSRCISRQESGALCGIINEYIIRWESFPMESSYRSISENTLPEKA